ncbi:hypothetical protein ACOMHN_058599 [Nucella lapillus]
MLCQPLRQRRQRQRRHHDRLVWASRQNVVVTGVEDRRRRYLSDFYTTLIDIQWRWNLLFFVVGFVLTWLIFALYYYFLCVLHGDLDPAHRGLNSSWIPCVENVNSFTEAYLFSIETMTTIGYGWRYQTEQCPGVYLAAMVQSIIGAGLQFALASLVVSKTRRANRISQTILFSNKAVIYMEDGMLKLAVRIGDMRKGDVIAAHATGLLIKKTMGKTGYKVPVRMFSVPFEAESGREKLFLCWPCLLLHTVDEHSPFWRLDRQHLLHDMYELIVVLDGVAATSSKPFQARKSYHTWEIMWGHRFKPLTMTNDDLNSSGYVVNYSAFHQTFPVPTPFCSAQMLDRRRLIMEIQEYYHDEDLETLEDLEQDVSSYVLRVCEDQADFTSSQPEVKNCERKVSESDLTVHSEDESFQTESVISLAARSKQSEEQTEKTDDSSQAESTERESNYSIETDTLSVNQTEPQAQASQPEDADSKNSTPAKKRVRKISRVEFEPLPFLKGTERRLSLGDAVNMYRHRRSVTDTYLGTELPEEETAESEASRDAIFSLVSQQCPGGKMESKEGGKPRRKSSTVQPLMFATEAQEQRETHNS